MAYAAWCDTDPPTKWWITGTGSVVNRLSEVMDDNASGVNRNDSPGTYVAWTTFMLELLEDKFYRILLNFEIGNGSTATTLTSENESVVTDANVHILLKAAATLTLGESTGDWSVNGAFWQIDKSADGSIMTGGTLNLYGSRLHNRGTSQLQLSGGTVVVLNSIFSAEHNRTADDSSAFQFTGGLTALTLKDVIFYNVARAYISITPLEASDILVHDSKWGIDASTAMTIEDVRVTTFDVSDYNSTKVASQCTLTVKNPRTPVTTPRITNRADNEIDEDYTFDLFVADPMGNPLAGVLCTLDGSVSADYDTQMFSVSTGADGKIAQQTVMVKKWVGTSETLTDYAPFRLKRTKAGYESILKEQITMNTPFDWHTEMQYPQRKRFLWALDEE